MDTNSLIAIGIDILVIFLFIKFILSPLIRIILGIIIFVVTIYLLQRFFGFNLLQVLTPFGISLDTSKWGLNTNWIMGPINHYADQIKVFFDNAWQQVPKSTN